MLIIILYQQFLICGIIYLYNFYTFYIIVHSLPFSAPPDTCAGISALHTL